MHSSFRRLLTRTLKAAVIAVGVLSISGCATVIYKIAGRTMINIGEDVATPYLMTIDDVRLACTSAEALNPLILSFSMVTISPNELETMLGLVNGACAFKDGFEAELAYTRFAQAGQIGFAKDARIESKRHYGLAAKRFYNAYQAMSRELGEPGEECPKFTNDLEELVWLMGSLSGLQAAQADIQADMVAGVPLNLSPKIERAAACLDSPEGNKKWWGLPKATRAAIWAIVPGVVPKGVDPWMELTKARKMGMAQGVRIPHVLDAIASYNSSKTERVRGVIREHANALKNVPPSTEFRMVDSVAADMLLDLSDRMWTEATGTRTPIGAYGTFWDDKKEEIEVDDNLLDELL